MSDRDFRLEEASFAYLDNIANIYLNERLFSIDTTFNMCVLIQSLKRRVVREIKRTHASRVFYKSVNLIVSGVLFGKPGENGFWCELVFNFLQFNIHLNLKTDLLNEQFYAACQVWLAVDSVRYVKSYQKCALLNGFKSLE